LTQKNKEEEIKVAQRGFRVVEHKKHLHTKSFTEIPVSNFSFSFFLLAMQNNELKKKN
jgi:hypothetical protein